MRTIVRIYLLELREYDSEIEEMGILKALNPYALSRSYSGYELILVFDAYKVKGKHREVERYHNINIVYTKESETADTYIERVTHELSKKHRVRVATSDGLEQIIILGNGAMRISAAELHERYRNAQKAIREYIDSLNK